MNWHPPTWPEALFAELPAEEQTRDRSFYHPMLLGFHANPIANSREWERIGITTDALPLPEDMTLTDRVRELFPEIEPTDARMIMQVKPLNKQGDNVHVKCPGCGGWKKPHTLLDVRTYPETADKPIFSRDQREQYLGPEVTVIDNDLTARDGFGNIVGPEITKTVRLSYSKRKVVAYEAINLKNGAGFVCDGCWTLWIRMGWRIDGEVYTKQRHVRMLGAPRV